MNEFNYDAFISYSHRDMAWARWLQRRLEARGIYVRRLSAERAKGRLRITIGTDADMERLTAAIRAILEEER